MFDRLKKTFASFVEKVSSEELTEQKTSELLDEFRLSLVENDIAISIADKICEDISSKLQGVRVGRFEDKRKILRNALYDSLMEILTTSTKVDLLARAEEKRKERSPLTVVFVGINGTGKTTTIGKVATYLMKNGFSVVLSSSDTYRAGAIEQLEIHAKRLGVKIIRHEYGSDAASVAFDAINYAKAHGINSVLIDTAGRMETNKNLMEEIKKIVRVTSPDMVIFVGDSLTGSDAVAQAEEFNNYVPLSASIMTKMDADAKGGAAVSVSYVTKKPVIFLGVGQTYEDLIPFNPTQFVETLLGRMEN